MARRFSSRSKSKAPRTYGGSDQIATSRLQSEGLLSSLAVYIAPKDVDLDQAIALLSSSDQQVVNDAASGASGLGARVEFEGLLRSTPIELQDIHVQACILRAFVALYPSQIGALSLIGPLVTSAAIPFLDPGQRCALIAIFVWGKDGDRDNLLIVANRLNAETKWLNGVPTAVTQVALLLDRNAAGATLIDELLALTLANPALTPGIVAYASFKYLLAESARLCLMYLSQTDRGQLRDILLGRSGTDAKTCYKRIVTGPTFGAIDPVRQARIFLSLLLLRTNSIPFSQGACLALSSIAAKADIAGTNDAMIVFDMASDGGRASFARLVWTPVYKGIDDRDAYGVNLLSNLAALATQALEPLLASNSVPRWLILDGALKEVSDPGTIHQGSQKTCTVTSMEFMLVLANPSEYVRLLCGLFSPAAEAVLKNGEALNRVADSIPNDSTGRSPTERIFQAAMMDYGDDAGIAEDYSNANNDSGLSKFEQRRSLEGLFGRDFHLWGSGFYVHRGLIDVLQDCMPTPTLADLDWGDDDGHAVVVMRVESDAVYFRNPWGQVSDAVGTKYSDPDRVLIDPAIRIELMSRGDFDDAVNHIYEAD